MSFRPALGPTHPPIQWVLGALSLGVKRPGREVDHSPQTSVEVCSNLIYKAQKCNTTPAELAHVLAHYAMQCMSNNSQPQNKQQKNAFCRQLPNPKYILIQSALTLLPKSLTDQNLICS
jgi:hypothetical protein